MSWSLVGLGNPLGTLAKLFAVDAGGANQQARALLCAVVVTCSRGGSAT